MSTSNTPSSNKINWGIILIACLCMCITLIQVVISLSLTNQPGPFNIASIVFQGLLEAVTLFLGIGQVYPEPYRKPLGLSMRKMKAIEIFNIVLCILLIGAIIATSIRDFTLRASSTKALGPYQKGQNTVVALPTKKAGTPSLSPTPSLTSTPTPFSTSSPPTTDDSASSLIPKGQRPVLYDLLGNNSEGYGWDEGENAQGTGRCDFVQGQYYMLSAPAESNAGVGCNTENPNGRFGNFVYQIKMTILEGIDDGNAEAGPTFRVNDNGSQYQVSFDANGYWSVTANSLSLSHDPNPFPYFHSGINQPNFITIRASMSNIQVQVNGHDLGSYVDSSNTIGFIGAEMSPGSSIGKVAFSNVRVWHL